MKEKRMHHKYYSSIISAITENKKQLAILIDPDVFDNSRTKEFLKKIPKETTHLFVGGSTVVDDKTEATVICLKKETSLPIILFPGNASQITNKADAILFLFLISGRNPEYLIDQQIKAVPSLKENGLEVISTGYLLINGGSKSSVEKISKTAPMSQDNIQAIVHTAKAGEYLGNKLIYLEAGSGASFPVNSHVIKAVKKEVNIPLIVGGGIRTEKQKQEAYKAGADMVVMGTYFENI